MGSEMCIRDRVGIGGHLTLAAGIKIAAKSGVSASLLHEGETYQGIPAVPVKQFQTFHIALRRLARIPLSEKLEALDAILKQGRALKNEPTADSKG